MPFNRFVTFPLALNHGLSRQIAHLIKHQSNQVLIQLHYRVISLLHSRLLLRPRNLLLNQVNCLLCSRPSFPHHYPQFSRHYFRQIIQLQPRAINLLVSQAASPLLNHLVPQLINQSCGHLCNHLDSLLCDRVSNQLVVRLESLRLNPQKCRLVSHL